MAIERDGAGHAPTEAGEPIVGLRLFIAVHLDAPVRASLAAASATLRAATSTLPVAWVASENFHVTLKFLGDVDAAKVPELIEGLHAAAAMHVAFEIEVSGLGAFPSPARPRALWAGIVAGVEPLAALARSIDDATVALGFPREVRAFSPHVTLGRVRDARRAPALSDALRNTRHFGKVPVAHAALIHSDLSPRGARYTTLASAPLERPRLT